jgi:hypothetical protein
MKLIGMLLVLNLLLPPAVARTAALPADTLVLLVYTGAPGLSDRVNISTLQQRREFSRQSVRYGMLMANDGGQYRVQESFVLLVMPAATAALIDDTTSFVDTRTAQVLAQSCLFRVQGQPLQPITVSLLNQALVPVEFKRVPVFRLLSSPERLPGCLDTMRVVGSVPWRAP